MALIDITPKLKAAPPAWEAPPALEAAFDRFEAAVAADVRRDAPRLRDCSDMTGAPKGYPGSPLGRYVIN